MQMPAGGGEGKVGYLRLALCRRLVLLTRFGGTAANSFWRWHREAGAEVISGRGGPRDPPLQVVLAALGTTQQQQCKHQRSCNGSSTHLPLSAVKPGPRSTLSASTPQHGEPC